MVIFGVVSLIFGIVFANSLSDDQRSLMMLAGMFSGAGTGIIAVAIFFWIRGKVLSPEKLKQKAIEKNDERNVQITRTALTVVAITSNLTFAVLAFVLMGMGYMVCLLYTSPSLRQRRRIVESLYHNLTSFAFRHANFIT